MDQSSTGKINMEKFADENARAEAAINNGDLKEAAGILVNVVQQDPSNYRAFNNMGIIAWTRHAWEDAYAMFRKAASLDTTYLDALVNLFDAALKLKRIREVLPFFEKAVEADPSLEEARIIRDSIQEQGDDIYSSQRALSIGVYSPLVEEANKELEAGNMVEAMELFLQANDTEGASAEAYCGLGVVSFYQKRYSDAFSLFIESIKLNPLDTDTFRNLLDAAKACGQVKTAKEIYLLYKEQFPSLATLSEEFEQATD